MRVPKVRYADADGVSIAYEVRGRGPHDLVHISGVFPSLLARALDPEFGGSDDLLASRTVKDLVAGSGIEFADRGVHELKGIPEPWQIYQVV